MGGTEEPGDALIDLHEAADRLGVHYMTAYRYVRLGRLTAVKEGGQWKVPTGALAGIRDAAVEPARRGRPRLAVYRQRLLDRLLANDEHGAWAVLEAARTTGLEPAGIHLALLAPALRTVGERWATGEIDVGDEHLATAVATRLVGRLGPLFARPGRRRGTVLVGGAPGDAHALPAAMLADVVRGAQYEVVELGPDTPLRAFVDATAGLDGLVAVCVSFSVSGHDDVVAEAVQTVREAVGVPVLVGGPACEGGAHAERLGADGTAADAAEAVLLLEALRRAAPPRRVNRADPSEAAGP